MLQMWLRYVACMLQYLCNVRTEFDENFTPGVKSPVDFRYGGRIDVWDPPTHTTFKMAFLYTLKIYSNHPRKFLVLLPDLEAYCP